MCETYIQCVCVCERERVREQGISSSTGGLYDQFSSGPRGGRMHRILIRTHISNLYTLGLGEERREERKGRKGY